MRIAVSGTHCCGKSSLVDAFLLNHPDFAHEPEPYMVLEEDYGEVFGAEPSLDDFNRQLEFNVERLQSYDSGERVICERSPVDFLAYMLALNDLRRCEGATRLIESSVGIVTAAISLLDLIAFLPLDENEDTAGMLSDAEDPELRKAVDTRLNGIFLDNDFDLFRSRHPIVLELRGSTAQRLRTLDEFFGREPAEAKAG
jgi:AAA domain-containing protein